MKRILILPLFFLLAFFAYPLWTMLAALDTSAVAWLSSDYVRRRLGIALWQALWSVVLTMAIALPLAWLYHTRRIRWGRLHLAVHAAPFVLPVFVVVFGIQGVFGPRGWFAGALPWTPLIAVVLAHAYYNYGFAARLLHTALERRPHRLEAAARLLGADPRQAFLRTTLPLLAPGLAAAALLVFFFSFTSFGVVLFLGSGEISTLETLLYRQLGGVRPRLGRAAALGILQLGINALVLWLYFRLDRRIANVPADPDHRAPAAGARRTGLAWLALGLGILPAASVLLGGFRFDGAWTLEIWRSLVQADHPAHIYGFDLWRALDRSLFYAFWTALLSIGLSLALGYGLRGRSRAGRAMLQAFAALPMGTSSLLLGFGFFLAFGAQVTGTLLDLRGTLWIVLAAHVLVAFPFTARTLLPALDRLDTRLDDAAALLGASTWATLWRVHAPALRAPLLAAGGFAAALSLGDFGASLLLMNPENINLSIWISRHDRPFDAFAHAQAVALAGLLMVLAAAAYVLVELPTWRRT